MKKKILLLIFTLVFLSITIIAFVAYKYYNRIFFRIVNIEESTYIFIPSNSSFDNVISIIEEQNIINDRESFIWLAKKKNYVTRVRPGKYRIKKKMTNNELVNLLRSGMQEPVKVIFNNLKTKEQLVSVISKQIEADSLSIITLLNDVEYLTQFDTDPKNSFSLFIPNTYEFYWNTSAEQFIERMYKEYKSFWNQERVQKAEDIKMTIKEVITLASIVEMETSKSDEKPIIAGVYINRLKIGMLLQADPTLKFAAGDFSLKRVLNYHKESDSPYNTYKYAGLPPGPICLPLITSIDAVLYYQQHSFYYFCADSDRPGYHVFTNNYQQHRVNARRYQQYLNRRKIYK